ncbi:RibD family protein [Aquipuribacter nitratireducens]|uniref:RibD family protein n=1 Tax=Aquipuribacter nitratireducens TaxID=650104 RepID=A0ABW0GS13_9MICO
MGPVDATAAWAWLRSPAARAGGARPAPADAEAADLLALYGPVATAPGRFALAQLGQSLDGCIATRTGDAVHVTGEADREHLHRLRALVDAVLVGVGTVVSDDPRLTVRSVVGRDPHRVVLDPAARAPLTARVLSDGAPVTWCVAEAHEAAARRAVTGDGPVRVLAVPCDERRGVDPHDVLDRLADRGLVRVLVEGGGRTVSRFLRAGALDRLHLSVAPVLLGADGTTGLGVPGPALARDALRPPSRTFRLGDDVCFDLDLAAALRTGAPVGQRER